MALFYISGFIKWEGIKSKCAKAHLKSLDSNLEAIHRRDGRLGAARVVKTYKPKAFALVCCSINEYLRQKQFVTQQKVFWWYFYWP